MESPRLNQDVPVDIPTDTSDQTTNLVSEIPTVDASKISQDPEINNAKAINHENSRILPEASVEAQDLSETTKSDRKSTGEAEETQSQQAQQVKSEEDNGEGAKSSDNQAAENLPESREAEEVPQEAHQSSESQENISQENVENKENNKSEPELKEAEEKVQEQEIPEVEVGEKDEEQIQEANNIVVEENNEVPQSENVVAEVEQRDNEVQEEQNVVNTEVKNEEKPEEQPVVESQPAEEPQNEEQVSEPKVENIEVQEPAKEPEAPMEEIKPVEQVTENNVEEQNNNTEPVVENKAEEQNNNEAVQVNEEVKPVEEVPETKLEEQNNNEVIQAPPQEEQEEEVVKTEEIKESEPVQGAEQKAEPVVEQQKGVFDFPVQGEEEAKPVEAEEAAEAEQNAEPVVEQQKGVFDFPVQEEGVKTEESNKQEVPANSSSENEHSTVTVEEKKEEVLKETRSPKLKNLRIDTQQNNVVTRIINYCAETGEPLPDASVAEDEKNTENSGEKIPSDPSVTSEGSSEVKKHYDNNQSLTDLLKPINMEEPQASPVIKRNATSTTCLGNPTQEENKEEAKEAQQPASAMIQSTTKTRLTMDDFQKITSLGRGSYGEVFLVKKIANNKLYALKSIDKNFMKKEKKEHQVYVEREVLMKLNHPNIIKLVSSFQDKTKLYFVLEYVSGGEFSDYLRVQGKLSKEQIIFFSAEIINILEYLHTFGIAHRDMKPENLLLTQEGHIKCIDFGTARFLGNDKRTADLYNIKKGEDTLEMATSAQKKNHRSTFVGTAQYVSPEMLEGSDCGAPADLWALGCMIYLMAVGQFPFIDMNEYLIFQKIKAASVKYPEGMDEEIKDIIQKLLVKEPSERLGAGEKESGNGYETLKGHPLFKNVDFSTINDQKPPVIEIASPHKKKSHDLQPTGNSNVGVGMQNSRKVNSEDLTKPSPAKTGQAFNFQVENQVKVILSGLVLKKCGWLFYKPRQLILNNKPRLVYYDPDSNQLKGEIPLAPTTKAELESKTKFIVNCPNKKFVFKEMEHSAEKWVEIINKTVEQLYAKKPDQ